MDVAPGRKRTDVGVLPEGWDVVPIGKAGHVMGGRQRSPHYEGRLCKYLRVANVFDGYIDTTDVLDMPFSDSEKQRFLLRDGDILLNEGQSLELVGRSAIYRGVPENCCFQNTLVRFRAGSNTYPEYAQLVFQQYLRTGVFASVALQTTSIAHLGAGRLATLKMPLPEKREQEAIAAALSDADALIESLEQLIAKKRLIKQGAAQELLTGKQRLRGFTGNWEVKSLRQIGECLIGLTYKPSDVKTDGILVLRSSNVFEGTLCFEDNVYVQMEIPERALVRKGDILICVRNGSRNLIGKCAKIDDGAEGMAFGAFMAVFRTSFHDFVYHQFQSDVIKQQINEHLGATINQITNKSLNSFTIPFPPDEAERNAIADILTDMDAEIAALEAKLAKARQIKQGMMQELLTGRIRLI